MKQIITLLLIAVVSLSCNAQFKQKVKLVKDGYETVDTLSVNYTSTGKSVLNKKTGERFEVFQTKNGKLFYFRKSKTGKEYRQYIETVN